MKSILLLFCLLLPASSFSQFQKTFGGSTGVEQFNSIAPTSDGGTICAGYTTTFGAGGRDIYIVRLDAAGDTLWTRVMGESGDDEARSIVQTSDGGFILTGYATTTAFFTDLTLVKLNAAGNISWAKLFGTATSQEDGYDVMETADGNFVACGKAYGIGIGQNDVYLVKADEAGTPLFSLIYGTLNTDIATSLCRSADGSYIMAGYTDPGTGFNDFMLMKVSNNGQLSWGFTYPYQGTNYAWGLEATTTGYVMTGVMNKLGLVKTDTAGHVLWANGYHSTGNTHDGRSVIRTADNGLIVGGYSNSFGNWVQAWVIKTDSNGVVSWNKHYGGSSDERCYGICQKTNGKYMFAGCTDSFLNGPETYVSEMTSVGFSGCNEGSSNITTTPLTITEQPLSLTASSSAATATWAPATSAGGNVAILCLFVEVPETAIAETTVYPNPVSSGEPLRINLDAGLHAIALYDLSGRLKYSATVRGNSKIPTEGLPAGIYLLEIRSAENIIACRKVVVQ
jgi:hypothetical protein